MADKSLPSSEKRERILQALTQASELESKGHQPHEGGHASDNQGIKRKAKLTLDEGNKESKTKLQKFQDCIQIDVSVLENKLVYFLFNVAAAGVLPFLSVYALQLGLPLWHVSLIIGAGLLAGAIVTPMVGFVADKTRLHRGFFVASVCMWMAFTLLAVYWPTPARVDCDVARVQLLEVMSEECREAPPKRINAYFEQMARFPIGIQTTPQPCTIDIRQICPVPVSSPNATSTPLSVTQEVTARASNLTERYKVPMRDTHLGWLYNQTGLQRASIAVFVFAAAGSVSQMSTMSMTDTATLVSLGEARKDYYGWQRSFGTMGYAISSLFVGVALHESRSSQYLCGLEWTQTDYLIGAVVFVGFLTISLAVSGYVRFKHSDMSSEHSLSTVAEAILTVNYGSVFVTAFVLSLCNGAFNTLLMWHLHSMGATVTLMGAGIAMHALSDVITSFCTVFIIKKSGYHLPLAAGLTGYCLTFFCFAIMARPGWLVVVEIIHGFSFAITLNTLTSFLSSSVALVSLATTQGLLCGVYWGLGPAVGTALFGYLADVIGLTLSFYALSMVCLVYVLIFLIWNRNDLPFIDKYFPGHYQPVSSGHMG
ncbi:major facilitator superfamily domain-containing protein 6-like [Asterias rubens]|uniref:major facilitator superfamily domain-containing protein 6-like n=1 Tax=Asterias rubens TaxID=7604 RepID=UPI0014556D50|nr:major facilitator superfamily domain-containing protein 6-like [Asterias rubens]